jgi:hypothetical protein
MLSGSVPGPSRVTGARPPKPNPGKKRRRLSSPGSPPGDDFAVSESATSRRTATHLHDKSPQVNRLGKRLELELLQSSSNPHFLQWLALLFCMLWGVFDLFHSRSLQRAERLVLVMFVTLRHLYSPLRLLHPLSLWLLSPNLLSRWLPLRGPIPQAGHRLRSQQGLSQRLSVSRIGFSNQRSNVSMPRTSSRVVPFQPKLVCSRGHILQPLERTPSSHCPKHLDAARLSRWRDRTWIHDTRAASPSQLMFNHPPCKRTCRCSRLYRWQRQMPS